MAGSAGLDGLIPVEFDDGRIFGFRLGMGLLPVHVGFHATVTGLTAHGRLCHRGLVGVSFEIVVFPHPSVVAGGAHLIPAHATARPVPPLAGSAILITVNIEPLAFVRIPAGLECVKAALLAFDQKLPERIMSDDSINRIDLHFAFKAERDDFVLVLGFARLGGLCSVLETMRRVKGCEIEVITQRSLGHAVIGLGPFGVSVFVA